MKYKRLNIMRNILINMLIVIILASLFGVTFLGLFYTEVNAESGNVSFRDIMENNPIFNLVGVDGQQSWLDFEVSLTAKQHGSDVILTATKGKSIPNEANVKYYWYYSKDGGTNYYNCIGADYACTTENTYEATFAPGNIYKVVVSVDVRNSYSLIWDAYKAFFNRGVDESGLNTWGTTLTQHTLTSKFTNLTGYTPTNEIASLAFAMVISKEYLTGKTWDAGDRAKLVSDLYYFALGRGGHPEEIVNWMETFNNVSGSTNVPIDVYYTVPNAVFSVINGICGSVEAGNKHQSRYYYTKSTGKYYYATATLTDLTTYLNEAYVEPSTLTIDPNGGKVTLSGPSVPVEDNTITTTTSYKQYASISSSLESEITFTELKNDSQDVVVNNYTVTYDANNGTLGTINSTNTDAVITETTTYSFNGWEKNPTTLNGTLSTNKYVFPNINGMSDTIKANWEGHTSEVNEGVILPNATRAGYTLEGWFTAANGGLEIGDPGLEYNPDENITLYAHWQPNATVTIRKQYEEWTEWANSGCKVALYQNGEEKYSYASGVRNNATITWNAVEEGTYDIYASRSLTEINTMVDTQDNLTIDGENSEFIDYYNVNLHRGTGIESVSGAGTYLFLQNVSIDAEVKPGYTWAHWTNCDCGENNCYCNPCNCDIVTTDKQTTMQVSWEKNDRTAEATPNTYTISYDLDGGTVAGSNPTSYTVEDGDITLINPTRAGYTFTGWTGTGLSGETMTVTIPHGSIGNRSYVAHWQINTAIVTIKKDNQNYDAGGVPVELRQNGAVIYSYENATKSGANVSWNNVTEGTYDIYAPKSTLDTSMVDSGLDIVIDGQSTNVINYYSVIMYRGTGIESVIGGGVYLYQQEAIVDAVVKPGYTWAHWTNCDCGENNCHCDPCDCEIITTVKQNIFQMPAEKLIRTAEATLNTYTISYDLDGGTVTGNNPTSYTVEDDSITLINPTKEGYTFTGWTGTGLSGNTMTVTIPHGSIGDRSYVAHWTEKSVTITINKNDNNWDGNSVNISLYQNGAEVYSYSVGTKRDATMIWRRVNAGTYDIYASKSSSESTNLLDTGVNVIVSDNGEATIDYYTLTLNKGVGIAAVTGSGIYLKNQTANIDATVSTGYVWEGWSVISGDNPD